MEATSTQHNSRRRRRLSSASRREVIATAAAEVFAERGYHAAGMDQIAAKAGVTAAVIYDHFPSKAALHNELLEQQGQEILSFVGHSLADAGSLTPEAQMRVGVDAFFSFVESRPFAWRMIFRDAPADPAVADSHVRVQQRATEAIAAFLQQGVARADAGAGDAQDFEMFAQLLKTATNGLAAWWYDHPEVPRTALVDRVMQFCWYGLEQLTRARRGSAKPRGRQ